MPRHVVATIDEIPPGGRKVVTVEGREIVVFNLGGDFVGVLNRCPHQGGRLCDGVTTGCISSDDPGTIRYERPGEFIRCPWHGWFFDLRTGQSWGEPDRVRTKTYDVSVAAGEALQGSPDAEIGGVDGATMAAGPYIAETIDVTTEQRYVVVTT